MPDIPGMRSSRRLSEERWGKVFGLFEEEGLSVQQLAERFGISSGVVRQHLKRKFGTACSQKMRRRLTIEEK